MTVFAMRSPYAFCRVLAALNILASFRVLKIMSTVVSDIRYLKGNILPFYSDTPGDAAREIRRKKNADRTKRVHLLGCVSPKA